MTGGEYDKAMLREARIGQGCKACRCTLDMTRRAWLGAWRSYRLSRRLGGQPVAIKVVVTKRIYVIEV